ncbi:RelA/SpoT domain-containing protein [Burkholderia cenocepacia]|uniref:RelA/SpoT domain-containing protein n=1 Tax=Burkholderia cenocepacia TaxID=95486 RepID=A0A6B2MBV4_9BURK|nr:RelA/SpoT domain-containing protein [Burkholderia cenocepacia]NDV73308.1 RelA/SpoT domain-containing protein [Burkholderia cenocepacia]RQU02681.1 (p)ppGpp synthetase [Burkholderia cenocepacia]
MSFPIPHFSRKGVTRAGNILIQPDGAVTAIAAAEALSLVNHWRSCHLYPINTFQSTLRARLKKMCPDALVAQRLKRVPSIVSKLERNPGMQLARMQDIGGLRAVVNSMSQVRTLRNLYVNGNLTHELVDEDDYIAAPKASGYRSVHLIYRYNNPAVTLYNGLCLELQIRTRRQHAWATAVETMGTFIDHALKANEGPEEWLQFFQVASAAIAHMEKCAPAEAFQAMKPQAVWADFVQRADRLEVVRKLRAFAVAANAISQDTSGGSYHLVVLDAEKRVVTVSSYGTRRIEEAHHEYARAEEQAREDGNLQVVLVNTDSIESLRRAYPNYFLDTNQFLSIIHNIRLRLEAVNAWKRHAKA